MAKKKNLKQKREQQKLEKKAKFAKQQEQRDQQKHETEEASKRPDINMGNEKKSVAKAAGVKSVFVVNDTIYMTSFGKGNDAVLEKKIVSDSHEDMNTDSPAFTLTDVNNKKYEVLSSRIKSLNATSDNPVHRTGDMPDAVPSDMLGLKSALEQKFYGQTFDNDNIHIQLIYNILDIEKILAQYSTNAVYAINNLLRESQSEYKDIFENMTTGNKYDEICNPPEDKVRLLKLKEFMESFVKNPRLAYYGTAFYVSKNNKPTLRNKKEIYDILALIGKLRHWCIHGNEQNSLWLYKLDSLAPEFHYIMDQLYDEAIKRINDNFVENNKVNIQILASIPSYSNEKLNDIIKKYYSFVVTKKYKNIGFSIKKLRELIIADTEICDDKYNTVRPKLYKLIDFVIWHGYENEDALEADRLVNELRASLSSETKEQIYIKEANRLKEKYKFTILYEVLPSVDGNYIEKLQDSKLDEINIGNELLSGAKDVSYFTKLMYLLTLFIDGKEINDLLTTLINKFDNIRSLNEIMEKLSLTINFTEVYSMFKDSNKILDELTELNSFAKMWPIDISAKRIMYVDALDILGIETNMNNEEFEKFLDLDNLLCLDANGKPIKDKKQTNSGLRNFIASNVIESTRFKYLIRYGNSKKIKKLKDCEPAVRFVLDGIPGMQIERYYKAISSEPTNSFDKKRAYLAEQIREMSFEKIEEEANTDITKGEAYIKKSAEEKQRYQALVRLYLTVMYLILKNLVNVNSRYVIGFHCLERDAALYGEKLKEDAEINGVKLENLKKDYCRLTLRLMGVSRDMLTGKCDVSKSDSAGNRHLKNKSWYEHIFNNLKNSDSDSIKEFRNTVAHLNAIRNIDENIMGIKYVNSYFEMYHYIIQRHLQSILKNRNLHKCTAEYFEKLDQYNSYIKDFVKAYCTPMAYSLARYKNLTIDGKFDKNRPSGNKDGTEKNCPEKSE